jgi:hypothetical protein
MIRQTLDRGYCDMPSLEGLDWTRVYMRRVRAPQATQ